MPKPKDVFRVTMQLLVLVMLICVAPFSNAQQSLNTESAQAVGEHYVYLAHEMFSDALRAAERMHEQIIFFTQNPNQESHGQAKLAWIEAHSVYSQTEVFRFGNPNVDLWEGRVNAWPMDEGLVDYVASDYQYEQGNPHALQNIIASEMMIDKQSLQSMHEKGGSEANVATGYHVIEFLLWGQDLNKEPNRGGIRPYTDYASGDACSNANCERRKQYLLAVSELLMDDLNEMVQQWQPSQENYAQEFLSLPTSEQFNRILFGMGSLSFGELAAERIRVALLANAQEDEQSCFSDTTDVAIYNNAIAVRNIYGGYYKTLDGNELKGPSIRDLVKTIDGEMNDFFEQQLALTMASAYEISEAADQGEVFDQQILAENANGKKRLEKMIDRLRNQTNTIEKISEKFVGM